MNQQQAQQERYKSDQDRLRQKLVNQIHTRRADGFAYANFPRPFLRPGSRKVHEIDTGDSQHQHTDDAEQTHIFNKTANSFAIFKIGDTNANLLKDAGSPRALTTASPGFFY